MPNIDYPDAAASALGRAAGSGRWLRTPPGEVPCPVGLDLGAAGGVVAAAVAANGAHRLSVEDEGAVLAALGVAVAPRRVVRSEDEAAAAAAELGGPVSLKVWNRPATARNEVGGVALDLHGEAEVRASFRRIRQVMGERVAPTLVQAMEPAGIDLRVTVAPAPLVGSVLGLGPGGVTGSVLDALARHVVPVTDLAAEQLVATVAGTAGLGPEAAAAVGDILVRVGRLADEVPEIHRLELNPVLMSDAAAWVTDARIDVRPWTPGAPALVRRL